MVFEVLGLAVEVLNFLYNVVHQTVSLKGILVLLLVFGHPELRRKSLR